MSKEATVRIRIYDLFQDRWITGKVERIDPLQARMKLVQEDETRWIKLEEIIDLVKDIPRSTSCYIRVHLPNFLLRMTLGLVSSRTPS